VKPQIPTDSAAPIETRFEKKISPRVTGSSHRRRWFRVVALVSPVIALLLLEVCLSVVGTGYPTHFFLPVKLGDRDVWIENPEFGRRYFPPGLERAPQPLIIPRVKPPNTVRVLVFGESAALGDPEPAFGFSRILELLLRAAVPGRRVEVINVGMTAINSHVIRDIAHDCAALQGDYWIVYAGHNEVVGPYGAGTVFGAQTPHPALIRAQLALKTTRVGQALDAIRWRLTPADTRPSSWEGLEMFLHQTVHSNDPRLARVYRSFAENLREIITSGQRSGAQVIVSTVAANLRDCAPFASANPALGDGPRAEWQRLYTNGLAALQANQPGEVIRLLNRAAAIDDTHAGQRFALGQAHLALGQTNEARRMLEGALELDTLRFRADAEINRIIRAVAAERPGIHLIDGARWIADRSPMGLPGAEFFYEHVHFNFAGNYTLAHRLAVEIVGDTAAPHLPSVERCAELLAFTDFDRFRVLDEVRQRLERPPFTGQWEHEMQLARIRQQLDALRSGSFAATREVYERAIAAQPDDWILRENFATLLNDFQLFPEALSHWQRMVELIPHAPDACVGLADALEGLGRSSEAIAWLRRALRLRSNQAETQHSLGLALFRAGQDAEAVKELTRASRLNPKRAEVLVDLGIVLAHQRRTVEAEHSFQSALRLQPDNVVARQWLEKLQSGHPAR